MLVPAITHTLRALLTVLLIEPNSAIVICQCIDYCTPAYLKATVPVISASVS